MLSFIKGSLISAKNGTVVLENNGIGYEFSVATSTLVKVSSQAEKEVQLYCYLHAREDSITLYGFYSLEEKNIFLKLISVTGVGPKAAMNILSGIELTSLITAIATKDIKTLSKIKGVGKKTAERITLELRESITADDISAEDSDLGAAVFETVMEADAVMALRSLGIAQKEAIEAVKKAKEGAKSLEELISKSLKNL